MIQGTKYNRLTVIKVLKPSKGRRYAICQCDCGQMLIVRIDHLQSGHTQSCGCQKIDSNILRNTKHGMHNTSIYRRWQAMKARCLNPNNSEYHNYGARGITVCDRWLNFENFYADMLDVPKGMTLDRIDNNRGYEPNNCKWATPKENSNNKRTNHYITFCGITQTMTQWAEKLGIKLGTLSSRLNALAWPIEKALTQPIKRETL